MSTSQRDLVLIMAREFSSRLATAAFLVDPDDNLIYFNEAAERVLGYAFQEGRVIGAADWMHAIVTLGDDGEPLPVHERPLGIALGQQVPTHRSVNIATPAGDVRRIEVTAFPLLAHADECVGAMSIFWEPSEAS